MFKLTKDISDFASLSEIFKNATRRKIIRCLSDKGNLAYVDLMNSVEVTNTGKFNYHLKILADLIKKDEDGKYGLSEKGKLASQFLQKFDNPQNEEPTVQTRAFSIFAGFMSLLLLYPVLGLLFGWYLYFTDVTVTVNGNLATQLIILSLIIIPPFMLISINQFPKIGVDRDSIIVKWVTGSKLFIMEEAKIDARGHLLRLGGVLPFGWFIPFKDEECFSLLNKKTQTYHSKPLYLTFALPPTCLALLSTFVGRVGGFFPPELWAIWWGATATVSLAMIAYSFPAEIHLGNLNRGKSAVIYGSLAGFVVATSLFLNATI